MKDSSLLEAVLVERVSDAVAAGTTAVNSDSVDLGPGQGVLFITAMGTVTTAPTVKVQTSSDDSVWNDLEGTEDDTIVDGDDDLLLAVDVKRPLERYVRLVMTRTAGNVVVDSIVAIVYNVQEVPTTQGADVAGEAKSFLAPAEGTA